jgi:hypothetical protein
MLIWLYEALPTAFFSLRQNKKEFYSLLAFCSCLTMAKMKSQQNLLSNLRILQDAYTSMHLGYDWKMRGVRELLNKELLSNNLLEGVLDNKTLEAFLRENKEDLDNKTLEAFLRENQKILGQIFLKGLSDRYILLQTMINRLIPKKT